MKKSFIVYRASVFSLSLFYLIVTIPMAQRSGGQNRFKEYFDDHVENHYIGEKNNIRNWSVHNNATEVKKI